MLQAGRCSLGSNLHGLAAVLLYQQHPERLAVSRVQADVEGVRHPTWSTAAQHVAVAVQLAQALCCVMSNVIKAYTALQCAAAWVSLLRRQRLPVKPEQSNSEEPTLLPDFLMGANCGCFAAMLGCKLGRIRHDAKHCRAAVF